MVWALVGNKEDVGQAARALLVLAGVLALLVYLSGENAEDIVEEQGGVSDAVLEAHEQAALGAAIATGVLGLIALALMFGFRKRSIPFDAQNAPSRAERGVCVERNTGL
ncbi:MAG: hypothetical protein HKN04_12395 [Rhodothermaceae bacterium]|nr:hypothetical protein [Rhodothermaceae bacterium]